MNRKHCIHFIRIAVTLGLLGYVCQRAGLFDPDGRGRLAEMIAAVHPGFLVLSIAVGVVANVACAFKWYLLLLSRRIRVRLSRLYAYYMVGRFFNLVLPTSVGGDVVRMYELGRFTGQPAEAVASVFVERFTGMATLMMLAIAAVWADPGIFNRPLIMLALAAGCAATVVIGWMVWDRRPLDALQRLAADRLALITSGLRKIRRIHDAVGAYRQNPRSLVVAGLNSLLFYVLAVLNVWVSALAFDAEVSAAAMVAAVPVMLLIMNLPVSIGGIGLMEFAYTFTFELIGYSSTLGFSTALLMRLKTFIDAGIGGGIYLFISQGRSLAADARREAEADRFSQSAGNRKR